MPFGNLTEIFYSLQGEGPLVGIPFLFVRMGGCNLNCIYCDTQWSRSEEPFCRIHDGDSEQPYPNPFDAEQFSEVINNFNFKYITFTGGEPLLQATFIEETLPFLKDKKILIETNGTLPEQVKDKLLERVDYWSADIKLPSVAGIECRKDHQNFFKRIVKGKAIFMKAVFSPSTPQKEILTAYNLASETHDLGGHLELIFQPLSNGKSIQLGNNLNFIYELSEKAEFPVKVIPQVHKILEVM